MVSFARTIGILSRKSHLMAAALSSSFATFTHCSGSLLMIDRDDEVGWDIRTCQPLSLLILDLTHSSADTSDADSKGSEDVFALFVTVLCLSPRNPRPLNARLECLPLDALTAKPDTGTEGEDSENDQKRHLAEAATRSNHR
ncbi:hypothetical protein BLNAU_6875 [Blattamonas nauphoetae]|uniref:Secreted protein n=1 Tax=Blattamonas nauphoetae TaxID=2049346 RepID=A0ABQ9Y357_9EUKA|nr:hypothetical protein BLNAU_6875 [Blattamonas nauphoetae]